MATSAETQVNNMPSLEGRDINFANDEYSVMLRLDEKTNSKGDDLRVGSFVGKGGTRIKTIIGKSKSQYSKNYPDDNLSGFRMQVREENLDDCVNYYVFWSNCDGCSSQEELNNIILKEVLICEGLSNGTITLEKKPSKKVVKKKVVSNRQRYSFWIKVNSTNFGKLIGVEGSVISELKHLLKDSLSLDKYPSVRVMDSGRVLNEQYHLTVSNTNYLPDSNDNGLWLSIQYTGPKSFKVIQNVSQSFINSVFNESSTYENDKDSDSEEEDYDDTEAAGGW